jgi:molybdenum cofactor cytidylyltransferase
MRPPSTGVTLPAWWCAAPSSARSSGPSSPLPDPTVAVVVLAAGAARRFGSPKLLAPLRGRPLLSHALELAARARDEGLVSTALVVVAGGDQAATALVHQAGLSAVINPAPERGLSSSLRDGLAALGPDTGAALILLGDQPLVSLEVIRALVGAWREGRASAVRPRYAASPATPGHPVLVDRSLWTLADRLEGDAGFGPLLSPGSPGVAVIDVPGANPDIDTPADLHTIEGSSS